MQADIFTCLSAFDSPKGSSNTVKTRKNISLYFKRRHLIIYNYADTQNKSARFCPNIPGDTTLQNLKSEKTRKISLVPIPRHENLADLFLILPGQLQMSS